MFEVIGERINTSRKLVQAAVAERNAEYIVNDVTDRNFLFYRKGTAKNDKIIKSLGYGPSRAQPQHVGAVPGWGIDA